MNNLKKAITRELKANAKYNKGCISEFDTISVLTNSKHRILIPPSSKSRKWKTTDELKKYLFSRIDKKLLQAINKDVKRIDTVYNSKEFKSAIITMEWKRSAMWGMNPKAEIKVTYKDNTCEYFESESISGCGYDKGSTAVAQCINQVNALLKKLYKAKNKSVGESNRDLLGYGSGYGILPSIEGGVGVSCYPRIMESIGLKFETITSTKTVDVYQIKR